MCIITKDKNIIINELQVGHVVTVPTDTVYGLAALISSEKAIKDIFKIKKRPLSQPLSIAVKDITSINTVAKHIPTCAQEMINKYLPGPWTFILEKQRIISDVITAGSRYVGIRVPGNQLLLDILYAIDIPIVLTSANIHGYHDCITAQQVANHFSNDIGYIFDDGKCRIGTPSRIVSFVNGEIQTIR